MLKIDEIQLQLPGLSPEDAQWVSYEVVRYLREWTDQPVSYRYLPQLSLQLHQKPGADKQETARQIAQAIIRQLRTQV